MKELEVIKNRLEEKAEKESYRLWRIAKRALEHRCSQQLINEIREEANWLHTTAQVHPERLLEWDFEYRFKYAFR